MRPEDATIAWFGDIGSGDTARVGGKGASLGELTRAGIDVPPGFVVTTDAYRAFLDGADPGGELRREILALDPGDVEGVAAFSRKVRDLLRQAPVPPSLAGRASAAYEELCAGRGDVPVAVRSSATCEDSAEASFAGLQDTQLWVRGRAELEAAVRSCWASLYNPESVSYRLRLELPEEQIAMGVVVQEMVDARCSGVMFSRSPLTGDRSVVTLEASWGLGSSIVSGEVTPDRYVVNKVTGEISDREVATKLIRHVPGPKGGVVEEPVPAEQQGQPCLSDDQVRALARLARSIEKHYGYAQDMEWAIAHGENDPCMLQSRPETVWSNREAESVSAPKARAFDHVFSVLGRRHDE